MSEPAAKHQLSSSGADSQEGMPDERRALHVLLSDDAHDGFRVFARTHGVTVAGFLEALGVHLGNVDRPSPLLRGVLNQAKAVDTERRERGR